MIDCVAQAGLQAAKTAGNATDFPAATLSDETGTEELREQLRLGILDQRLRAISYRRAASSSYSQGADMQVQQSHQAQQRGQNRANQGTPRWQAQHQQVPQRQMHEPQHLCQESLVDTVGDNSQSPIVYSCFR